MEVAPVDRFDLQFLVNAFAPKRSLRVLELGCGKGVNAKFFGERGDTYTGLDLFLRIHPFYEKLGTFLKGDFTEEIPTGFDLICERGGFSYNPSEALARTVALVNEALIPGGLFIVVDIHADKHPEIGMARPEGTPRAMSVDELKALFEPFEALHFNIRNDLTAHDFVGRKRAA